MTLSRKSSMASIAIYFLQKSSNWWRSVTAQNSEYRCGKQSVFTCLAFLYLSGFLISFAHPRSSKIMCQSILKLDTGLWVWPLYSLTFPYALSADVILYLSSIHLHLNAGSLESWKTMSFFISSRLIFCGINRSPLSNEVVWEPDFEWE